MRFHYTEHYLGIKEVWRDLVQGSTANSSIKKHGAAHPKAFAPGNFTLTLVLSILGAIVGIQVLVNLGITPNTSLVGALIAMSLARIPLRAFSGYRSIH